MYTKGLKQNINLARYTTYKIGGPADYFFIAKDQNGLNSALNFAQANDLPVFILAGGSNVLFSDEGFRGLVIKIEHDELRIQNNKIIAGAGVMMTELINAAIGAGLAGLEWAGGLPGTLGGAIRGNAGCFGGEIKDALEQVTAFSRSGELKYYSNKDCCFSYRNSVFKRNGEIIFSAVLSLCPGDSGKLREKVFDHIKYRQKRQPLNFPNCGSIFKNCPPDSVPDEVRERFSDKIKLDPFPILPTAVLIGAAGLKGLKVGGAMVSEKHSNFIINTGKATASDIMEIIDMVKEKIKKEFDVNLYEEIELIGFE